jgi:hypothetical protein
MSTFRRYTGKAEFVSSIGWIQVWLRTSADAAVNAVELSGAPKDISINFAMSNYHV